MDWRRISAYDWKFAFKGLGCYSLGILSGAALGGTLLSNASFSVKLVFAPPLVWATYALFTRFYRMLSLIERPSPF